MLSLFIIMPSFFYLIYQLKGNDNYWIVDISKDFNELKLDIEGYYSSIEKYYIVSKYVPYLYMPFFKQFTKFKFNKNCTILFETS